jgi:hypothetical protein
MNIAYLHPSRSEGSSHWHIEHSPYDTPRQEFLFDEIKRTSPLTADKSMKRITSAATVVAVDEYDDISEQRQSIHFSNEFERSGQSYNRDTYMHVVFQILF